MIFFLQLSLFPLIPVASFAQHTGRWMGLRQVGRELLKPIDLTWVNLLILAVVIAAIITVFSAVYRELLRPLGNAEAQQIPTERNIT